MVLAKLNVIDIAAPAEESLQALAMNNHSNVDEGSPNRKLLGSAKQVKKSIVDFMGIEIELALTFAQIAKTSCRDAETKTRNLDNARRAYGVVARLLATNDSTGGAVIAHRLSELGQRIAKLERVGQAGRDVSFTS